MLPSHPIRCLLLLPVLAAPLAVADIEFPGDPIPLADAKGKTGPIRVTLGERSPLSAPKEIIKRMHLPKDAPANDYDWKAEIYDLFVPKEPGEGGKYGLMVGAVFKDFGAPPGDWGDELDKHHVIWICSETVGDAQPDVRRVGTMLDAAHNVGKAFPIQDGRVYASMGGGWNQGSALSGVPLYYADVFDGAMYTVDWLWYTKLRSKNGGFWEAQMPAPDGERLAIARSRGRYFFVRREEDQSEQHLAIEAVKKGFPSAGLSRVKLTYVAPEKMGHYGSYDPSMFEEAIAFLDATLATLPPKTAAKPIAPLKQTTAETEKPAAPAPAAGSSEDADKAAKALDFANNYLAVKRYDLARPKLQKIVQDYPNTPAGKEAKKILKEIEGK